MTYLIRCPACNKENYLPAAKSGQCVWCGYVAPEEKPDPVLLNHMGQLAADAKYMARIKEILTKHEAAKAVKDVPAVDPDPMDYSGYPEVNEDFVNEQKALREEARSALSTHTSDEEGLCEDCGLDLGEIGDELRSLRIDPDDIPTCKTGRW